MDFRLSTVKPDRLADVPAMDALEQRSAVSRRSHRGRRRAREGMAAFSGKSQSY